MVDAINVQLYNVVTLSHSFQPLTRFYSLYFELQLDFGLWSQACQNEWKLEPKDETIGFSIEISFVSNYDLVLDGKHISYVLFGCYLHDSTD